MKDNILELRKEQIIRKIIIPQVVAVREDLDEKYSVYTSPEHKNYEGLCFEAYLKLKDKIEKLNGTLTIEMKVDDIHGEQRHAPSLKSKYWPIQHTWSIIEIHDQKDGSEFTVYADPTCEQFQDIWQDIPKYYVSEKKPKWFYPDRKNPVWHNYFGVTRWINKHIFIPNTITYADGSKKKIRDGIIEFIQYEIWGRISDFIGFGMHDYWSLYRHK